MTPVNSVVCLQGTFKSERPLTLDDLLIGFKLDQPLKEVPWWLKATKSLTKILASFFSSATTLTLGTQPQLLTPIATACQCIHVAAPGEKVPEIRINSTQDPTEDIRALDPQCCKTKKGASFPPFGNLLVPTLRRHITQPTWPD